jgi:hypothetical protein
MYMVRDSTQNTADGVALALLKPKSTCRIYDAFPNISLESQGTSGADHSREATVIL